MKNKVIVTKSNNQIHFFLKNELGTAYLFSQKYTKGVYDHFRNGCSDNELHKFRYKGNKTLNHTIDKCLNKSYRRYALEDLACA